MGRTGREHWSRDSLNRLASIAVAAGDLLQRNHGEIGKGKEGKEFGMGIESVGGKAWILDGEGLVVNRRHVGGPYG